MFKKVSGLLTEVFLQLSFEANLPKALDYLTLMDWIFNIAYFALFFIVVECIYVRKLVHRLYIKEERVQDTKELAKLGKVVTNAVLNSL